MTDKERDRLEELTEKIMQQDVIEKKELLEYLNLKAYSIRIGLVGLDSVGQLQDVREIYKSIGIEQIIIELNTEAKK
ncbi:hypothetical protein [Cetobacterium sp.]|uniref:hypothetical protein n=1 Tax=Cetobacterium sp. TaxID=2071632 RepID=UPI003F38D581